MKADIHSLELIHIRLILHVRKSNGPLSADQAAVPTKKRKSRKEQRKIEKLKEQEERLETLKKPSAEVITMKKDRKLTANYTSTMAYGFAVEGRDKRVQELKMLLEYETDASKLHLRRKALMDLLDSAPPCIIEILTSGTSSPLSVPITHTLLLFFSHCCSPSLSLCFLLLLFTSLYS